MAALQLVWNNTALLADANVVAVRALQRQKVLGGTFYTTGFSPVNDLASSLVSTDFIAYVVNKVYEFKVESICSAGGPTENDNGIQEGIVFDCLPIVPDTVLSPSTSWAGIIDLSSTDIEGVIYTLKKQADNTIVSGPTDVPKDISNESPIVFTGLTTLTAYYIEAQFYATVNGVLKYHSCGGNVSGWQFETL